jgi:hypothetical protein
MDKDLGAARKERWAKAFTEENGSIVSSRVSIGDDETDYVNRKATIVMEHLIQASDVSHTMQHWHVYRKWNQRLFNEMYTAYKQGRAEKDPSENWYQGEIGFFDFYIIPLAKKLQSCGVFGVSSDEVRIGIPPECREHARCLLCGNLLTISSFTTVLAVSPIRQTEPARMGR